MERICTENPACKLFPRGVTETDKTSRCYLSFVPREKLLCQAAHRVFYSLFWKKLMQAAGFWSARESHYGVLVLSSISSL